LLSYCISKSPDNLPHGLLYPLRQSVAFWELVESADENYMRVSRCELAAPFGLEMQASRPQTSA